MDLSQNYFIIRYGEHIWKNIDSSFDYKWELVPLYP